MDGLSPRVRGNRSFALASPSPPRSIPACAGEPTKSPAVVTTDGVYPRVCGGTLWQTLTELEVRGLSPRVRGNRRPLVAAPEPQRSIPACAGEPPFTTSPKHWGMVYPRLCGGTISGVDCGVERRGLSPRVRGNRTVACRRRMRYRSIPACAGEPHCRWRCASPALVYPRVCGGTRAIGYTLPGNTGLSPRVRGNPVLAAEPARYRRSIPACAGEPSSGSSASGMPEVYPRVCGGTWIGSRHRRPVAGLSPRVRGNLPDASGKAYTGRSIPACAGEPYALECTFARC